MKGVPRLLDMLRWTSYVQQVREEGDEQFGTKVEVKNMNSFSAMQRAIEFEIDRQVRLLVITAWIGIV